MKRHLKRNFTPGSWLIKRKENTFIVKPRPGTHAKEFGLPLSVVLKESGYAKTTRDVQNILQGKEILIDGKRRKDQRFMVGLMDVMSLPETKKNYRMIFDSKGRLKMKEIGEEESKIKIGKIVGKTVMSRGKIQFNLHDGKNILNGEKGKVGDSLVLELPDNKIKQVLELKKEAYVYLLKGKHAGNHGVLQSIEGNKIVYQKGKEKIETLKDYALVIGEKEPLIKVENGN